MPNCLTKYNNLNFKERGFHKMIDKMNKCISEKQKKETSGKAANSQYHDWFLELEDLMLNNFKPNDPVLSLLLPKLESYGEVCILIFFFIRKTFNYLKCTVDIIIVSIVQVRDDFHMVSIISKLFHC